jgi:predicted nucleic acid-binding protein
LSRILILNASPTIILAKIGKLSLLEHLASAFYLPEAVAEEILQGSPTDPAYSAISAGWGQRLTTTIPTNILEWGLGAGESSVLSIALNHNGWIAVLDDAKARQCAKAMNLPVMGTLGLILLAKKEGILSQAKPVFREIQTAGLFLEDRLIRSILSQVGETWDI